jgi:tRNA(Arg) A34 adenosine deaminase TadA
VAISDDDLAHLGRCVELAREALEGGDEPFGSILVDESGRTRFEDRNRSRVAITPVIPSSRSRAGRSTT